MAQLIYQVCIPHTHHDGFDYDAHGFEPSIGARVWVPFRKQTRMGVVIGKERREQPSEKIKSIAVLIDETPLLSSEVLVLCQWISRYYQSPLSEVIPLALPKKYRLGHDTQWPTCEYYQLTMDVEKAQLAVSRKAIRQAHLIDFISHQREAVSKQHVLQAGFTTAQLHALLLKNILVMHTEREKPQPSSTQQKDALPLNPEQALALRAISEHLQSYHCFLLQGVTGSGKTEVYLQVISNVLSAGRQVLVLVPEIGLTPQLLARFRERFHQPMAVIHSGLNDTERQLAWLWAKEEVVQLVIGTRAAIFTPMPALGLIIIDEEHDVSLKQMDGVRYSARDSALMRAHLRDIPIILGSATPSLESLYNATQNKYTLLPLRNKALNSKALHYQIVDIRNQILQDGLSHTSLGLIKEHLEQKNQVLVFINRRGFSPVLLCHQCGWIADCRACDAHLTLHRARGELICHHCGLKQTTPQQCQQCHSRELLPIGAGTQRIYECLSKVFPDTPMLRIDRDVVSKKRALDECLARINDGHAQLIVGTQMLAKGHHFPRLTLVVVIDTDHGFYNHDFRALERLGQLLTQVAGRAGRAEYPGEVMIQTRLPQHPLLNVLIQQGYDAFAQSLLTMRQQALLPPYHFLTLIRAQSKSQSKLLNCLHVIKEQLHLHEMNVLGPAPAPLARKDSLHRMQLLVKSPSRKKMGLALAMVRQCPMVRKISNGVHWSVDVDPIELS
jgi:primosomal protein N' (replication factor Y)